MYIDSLTLDILTSFCIKITAITAACWLISKWIANRDPAMAHRIWLFNGLSFLVLPLALFLSPISLEIPFWETKNSVVIKPAPETFTLSNAIGIETEKDERKDAIGSNQSFFVSESEMPHVNSFSENSKVPKVNEAILNPTTAKDRVALEENPNIDSSVKTSVKKTEGKNLQEFLPSFGTLASIVYLLGVLTILLWLALRSFKVQMALQQSTEVDVHEIEKLFPSSWQVPMPILESTNAVSPALANRLQGFQLKSVIVLPTSWRAWSKRQLQSVIAHEEAHYNRKDLLWRQLSDFVVSLFWFHPCAWLVKIQLNRFSELACDQQAANKMGNPVEYAGHLVEIAQLVAGRRSNSFSVGMARSSQVGSRVQRLLDDKFLHLKVNLLSKITASVLVMSAFVLMSVMTFADPNPVTINSKKQLSEFKQNKNIKPNQASTPKENKFVIGKVVDKNGKELEGILVEAYWTEAQSISPTSTRTKKGGQFQLRIPEEIDCRSAIDCLIVSRSKNGMMQGGYIKTSTTNTNGKPITIRHLPASILTFRIYDSDPAKKAKGILLHGWKFLAESETNSDGVMSLRYPAELQPQDLVIKKAGLGATVISLKELGLKKGPGYVRKNPLVVRLAEGFTTKIKFVDSKGKPVSGVACWPTNLGYNHTLDQGENFGEKIITTDFICNQLAEKSGQDGIVTIDWMPNLGGHLFDFRSKTHGHGRVFTNVFEPNEVKVLQINVRKLKTVSFQVLNEQGKPAVGKKIRFDGHQSPIKSFGAPYGSFNSVSIVTKTNSNGFVTFKADPFWFYKVSVLESNLFFQVPLHVKEGELIGLTGKNNTCVIGPGTKVKGKVNGRLKHHDSFAHVFNTSFDFVCPDRDQLFEYVSVFDYENIASPKLVKDDSFEFVVGPGKYKVSYGNQTKKFEIAKGQKDLHLSFDMPKSSPERKELEKYLKIKVIDEDSGQPLSGGQIEYSRNGEYWGQEKLTQDGEATAEILGNYDHFALVSSQGKDYGVIQQLPINKKELKLIAKRMENRSLKLINSDSGNPLANGYIVFDLALTEKPAEKIGNSVGMIDKSGRMTIAVFPGNVIYKAVRYAKHTGSLQEITDGFDFAVKNSKIVDTNNRPLPDKIKIKLKASKVNKENDKNDPENRAKRFFLHANQFPELFKELNSNFKKEIHSKKHNILLAVGDPRDVMAQHFVIALLRNNHIANHLRRSRDTIFEAFYPLGLEVKNGKVLTTKEIEDSLPCKLISVKNDVVFYVFENGKLKTARRWSEFWDSEKGLLDTGKWIQFLDGNGNQSHRNKRLIPIHKQLQEIRKLAKSQSKKILILHVNGTEPGKKVLLELVNIVKPYIEKQYCILQTDSWVKGDLSVLDSELQSLEVGRVWVGIMSPDGKLIKKSIGTSFEFKLADTQSLNWFLSLLRKLGMKFTQSNRNRLNNRHKIFRTQILLAK